MSHSRMINLAARGAQTCAGLMEFADFNGDWIQVHSGGRFYPADPRPEHIDIVDIARALSRLCRYAGHCEWFYSVAQHSVYVSAMVEPEFALTALLHDGTEAYIADLPRPVKKLLPSYVQLEDTVWRAVAQRFGLPDEMPACVKVADNAVLLAEKEQIVKPGHRWSIPGTPAPIEITRMDPDAAYDFFMRRYEFLQEQRNA